MCTGWINRRGEKWMNEEWMNGGFWKEGNWMDRRKNMVGWIEEKTIWMDVYKTWRDMGMIGMYR